MYICAHALQLQQHFIIAIERLIQLIIISRRQVLQIIRCILINDVQPVHVEQMRVAAPFENRLLRRIALGEVELRLLNRQILFLITEIFVCQSIAVILKMA